MAAMKRVNGHIEVSYMPKIKEKNVVSDIKNIIEESGGSDIKSFALTGENRIADIIYEFEVPKEEAISSIQKIILSRMKDSVENVLTFKVAE